MERLLELKHLVLLYYPTVLPVIVAVYNWVTRDLMTAISQADKDNDGSLTGPELEDIAVELIKRSKNLTLRAVPEFLIRFLIRRLCSQRKVLLKL